jgi:carbon starvation protein
VWANVLASGIIVALWGYFLIAAVYDKDGGIKAMWPIFGIANQLLAALALCLATTILLKMGIARKRPALVLVTLIPLAWLLTVTVTASVQKIWHEKPSIGFLAKARLIETKDIPEAEAALAKVQTTGDAALVTKTSSALNSTRKQLRNQYINVGVTGFFLAMVIVVLLTSIIEWLKLLRGDKPPTLSETVPVLIPLDPVPPASAAMGAVALGALLLKELSGEAAIERERQAQACECAKDPTKARRNVYLSTTERQFQSPNRCC